MSAYAEASRAVFELFEQTSPLVEGLSIDEAFLDVRGLECISGSATEIARRLRRYVRKQVGLPITVGVAHTKHLAKVASCVAKPDGLLVVPPGEELAFLDPLPVRRLWGVGPVTARKLHEHGLATVGESRAWTSPRWSRSWAGPRAGICTPSPTTATRAGFERARVAARSDPLIAAVPSGRDRAGIAAAHHPCRPRRHMVLACPKGG